MATLILNPNPVFDRTIGILEMVPGAVIRTRSLVLTAGGKGINVARVLRALGDRAPLLIPIGVDDRPRYEALLAAEGAEFTTVEVPGGVRVASIYLEEAVDRVTVVNDAGWPMAGADWDRVRAATRAAVAPGDVVLCMGSFPLDLPAGSVGSLVDDVHAAGGRILVDTAPQWLPEAVAHGADIVTPNLDEAEATIASGGTDVMASHNLSPEDVRPRAEAAARDLCEQGARIALVTAGSAGVAMARGDESAWFPAFPVDAVSTVGAGDSFVGGFSHVWSRSDAHQVDWSRAINFGVAAAAASCEHVLAGGAEVGRIHEIFDRLSSREAEAIA
jgi:1-phosphofructokinase family hexose kinase